VFAKISLPEGQPYVFDIHRLSHKQCATRVICATFIWIDSTISRRKKLISVQRRKCSYQNLCLSFRVHFITCTLSHFPFSLMRYTVRSKR